jgi:hypothetical protein
MPTSAIVPGAPLERPAQHTPLRSFAGTVPAAADRVFAELERRVRPGRPEGGSFSVDPVRRLVVVQGGWWYRGEWRVLAEGAGSRVEYEIVNVAPTAHWAGPVAGRAVLRGAPAAFDALMAELARVVR